MESKNTETDHLLDQWATDQRRRGVLASSIATRAVQARAVAADHDLLTITGDQLHDWMDQRTGRDGGPLADRTRYCYMSSLTDLQRFGRRAGLIDHAPLADAERPRLRALLPRPIPDDARTTLLHHCRDDPRMTLWIKLAYGAGLRVSEIAGLEGTDIIRSDPWHLHVVGKGRKERYVPVHDDLRAALEHYGIPARGPLFRSSTGRPYTGQRVSALMVAYFRRIDVPHNPHELRHWFGTELVGNGVPLRVVQELMGHSSPNTTAGYSKVRPAAAAAAIAGLAL